MYIVTMQAFKHTTKWKESHGKVIFEATTHQECCDFIENIHCDEIFIEDDGNVHDCDGNLVFDTNYADSYDFGDFWYNISEA